MNYIKSDIFYFFKFISDNYDVCVYENSYSFNINNDILISINNDRIILSINVIYYYVINEIVELHDFINYNSIIKKYFEQYYRAYKIFLLYNKLKK